jgi:hypothetical protein
VTGVRKNSFESRGPVEGLMASEISCILKCGKSKVFALGAAGLLPARYKLFGGDKG